MLPRTEAILRALGILPVFPIKWLVNLCCLNYMFFDLWVVFVWNKSLQPHWPFGIKLKTRGLDNCCIFYYYLFILFYFSSRFQGVFGALNMLKNSWIHDNRQPFGPRHWGIFDILNSVAMVRQYIYGEGRGSASYFLSALIDLDEAWAVYLTLGTDYMM